MVETILLDKVYGCLLGGAIGDALGGPVEKWTSAEIYEKYGNLDRFVPYEEPQTIHGHFGEGDCVGVYTDDTRLKNLYCEAIFRAQGVPRTGELVGALVEAYQHAPDEMHKGFFEEYYLKAIWQNDKVIFSGEPTNGAIMANSPLGLITACRPHDAYQLGFDLGWFAEGYAKTAAAIMAAAVAEAMRSSATVDSIVDAARESHLMFSARREGKYWQELEWRYDPNITFLDQALEIARTTRDVFQIREPLVELLEWGHLFSEATHTLVVALSMFVAASGDLEKSIIGAVMYGRDKDSYASVVGALAGAFWGAHSIRVDWRDTIIDANPSVSMAQYAEKLTQIIVRDEQRSRVDLDDLRCLM